MAKLRTIQTSFVAGEFDPTLLGRVDIDDYAKGASKLENVYVRPQGGAFRREGLKYYAQIFNNNTGRIIPFQFNDEQTYVLVFTAGRFDVYKTDSLTLQATVTSSPVSNITEDMLDTLNWTQSADTLILFHPDLKPIRITRTSDTAWTADNAPLSNIPPFAFNGITTSSPGGTVTADVVSGIVTLTSSTSVFNSSYVGQFINTPKDGRIYITQFNSSSEVEGVVRQELEGTSAISDWELEEGYEDVISITRGWPRSGTFHKSRLVLGGLKSRPQTIIMSKIGDFFNLNIGEGLDDEAIDITIDDDQVNVIRGVFSGRGLNIFTSGGEFSVRSAINEALTPSTIANQLSKETRHGASTTKPVSVDGAVVFIERESPQDPRSGRILRQFVFSDTEQSFNAPNISLFSQHLISNPRAMDIRRSTEDHPSNYLYIVNDDGTVAVLNSLREQSLLAFTQFTTDGLFKDVAVSGNQTFFIVEREINGSTVQYLEVLDGDHFLDSSVLQTDTATTAWSGLSNLEAEEVRIRGNDFILGNETVSSGAVTTDQAVTKLEAGMMFSAVVESLPLSVVIQGQSFSGEFKSSVYANVRCYNTRNFSVSQGRSISKPPFVNLATALDETVELFTGWKKVYIGGTERELKIKLFQDDPLEFNILAIHYAVKVS